MAVDFVSKARAQVAAGQFLDAVKTCRIGLLGQPGSVPGRLALGHALEGLGRHDEVLAEMHSVIGAEPGNAEAAELLARARAAQSTAAPPPMPAPRAIAANAKTQSPFGDPQARVTPAPPVPRQVQLHQLPVGEVTSSIALGVDDLEVINTPAPELRGHRLPTSDIDGLEIEPDDDEVELAPVVVAQTPPRAIAEIDAHSEITHGAVNLDEYTTPVPPMRAESVDDFDDLTSMRELPKRRSSVPARPADDLADDLADNLDDDLPDDLADALGSLDLSTRPSPKFSAREIEPEPMRAVDVIAARRERQAHLARNRRRDSAEDSMLISRELVPAVERSDEADTRSLTAVQARSAAVVEDLLGEITPQPAVGAKPLLPEPLLRQPVASQAAVASARTVKVNIGGDEPRSAPLVIEERASRRRVDFDDSTGIMLRPADSPNSSKPTLIAEPPRALESASNASPTGKRAAIPAKRPAKNWLRIALWSAAVAAVIGAGILGGLFIRNRRLESRISGELSTATTLAQQDTWRSWRAARDRLASVVVARDSSATRGALARAQAVLAAEYDDDVDVARAAVAALPNSADRAVASGYLALVDDKPDEVTAAAGAAVKAAGPKSDTAQYLVGRAAMLHRQWDEAVSAFTAAVAIEARPASLVALASAQLKRRDFSAAQAALSQAFALVPTHPAATIALVALHVERGDLAPDAEVSAGLTTQLLSDLDRLIVDGKLPIAQQTIGVAPRQLVDLQLATIAIDTARGDLESARAKLDTLLEGSRPKDRRFAEELVEQLLRMGQFTAARAEATQGLTTWPASFALTLGLAQTAYHDRDPAAVVAALADDKQTGTSAEALTLRGRARLLLDENAAAKVDLDAALVLKPTLHDAILGRAQLFLREGDAAAAVTRIEKLAEDPTDGEANVVLAAALRATGDKTRARAVLQAALDAASADSRAALYLELARALRSDGDLTLARGAYEKAIEGDDVAAKREAAALFLGDSDPALARSTLEAALTMAPTDPRLMLDAIRLRTLTGDVDGARELLARLPTESPQAPAWERDRERGRLALRGGDLAGAMTLLERAIGVEVDLEACLLLIDAEVASGAVEQLATTQGVVLRRFFEQPERFVVIGRVHLLANRLEDAKSAFMSAQKELDAEKAEPRRLALAVLGLAQVAAASRDGAKRAQPLFAQATKLDPSLLEAWAGTADTARMANDLPAALAAAQRVSTLAPDDPGRWFDLGELATSLNKTDIAKQALQRYLALSPEGDFAGEAKAMLAGPAPRRRGRRR